MLNITKLLVANRGEIAYRIIKTASGLGIQTVAVFAEDDRNTLHVSHADEACSLGDGDIKDTYLNIARIVNIAVTTGCDAVHPGYGFLAENFLFALACQEKNLIFIGPMPGVLKQMGNKTAARNMARQIGIPIPEGFECPVKELLSTKELHFPLIIKPTLGGGGKGMYIVHNREELEKSLGVATREAENYFADARVYFEHYIELARHIEVQIAADHAGNVVHLFERECTVQRNFQKILEEAPSPSLDDQLRSDIISAAVRIAQAAGYTNIGTVEFLIDPDNNWYFIEMNTRIQVEYAVTEAITGIDLVKLQLDIASGRLIPFKQDDIYQKGHAIELRINAEDTIQHFRPSAGFISLFQYPGNCRFDTFLESPCILPSQYDSLLGKLIIQGASREEACTKALNFLRKVHIHGLETNILFLENILTSGHFRENNLYTRFCNDIVPSFIRTYQANKHQQPFYIPIIAFVYLNFQRKSHHAASIWKALGYWRAMPEVRVKYHKELYLVKFKEKEKYFVYNISDTEYEAHITEKQADVLSIEVNGIMRLIYFSFTENKKTHIEICGFHYVLESPDLLHTAFIPNNHHSMSENHINEHIRAPLYGRVIKINVFANSKINRGDILLVIESMKTENNIIAPRNGLVKTIHVTEGAQVQDNMLLIELE
jgi:3-methylcrotonyl-CoA carboxylase alpha subunit